MPYLAGVLTGILLTVLVTFVIDNLRDPDTKDIVNWDYVGATLGASVEKVGEEVRQEVHEATAPDGDDNAEPGAGARAFEGTWSTQDSKGNPFTITLLADGRANGDRADEGLKGTWKTEADSAVITWDSGWVTKIITQGGQFKKQAFQNGNIEGPPAHTADARKL